MKVSTLRFTALPITVSLVIAFLVNLPALSGQITMTFNTGPNQPGFTFSGWSGLGGILYPTNAGVGDVAQITKNSLTWDLVSFQTRPYGGGNGTWQATSDKGDTYNFVPNSGGPVFTTHTLNWVGISWLKVSLLEIGSGGNQSFDFDNVVYFENSSPPCNIQLDGVSKINASCCTNNGIIIVTPVSCTCVGSIEYSVNNGASWQSSYFFGGLAPGNYTVKIRDSGNPLCMDTYIVNPVVVTAVPDNTPPQAVCHDTFVQLDLNGMAGLSGAMLDDGSTDNCYAIKDRIATPGSFGCAHVGINTVILTVTDSCNNAGTCTALVTVQNNHVPIAICKNAVVQLDASGNGIVTPAEVDNGSSAVCGIQNMTGANGICPL